METKRAKEICETKKERKERERIELCRDFVGERKGDIKSRVAYPRKLIEARKSKGDPKRGRYVPQFASATILSPILKD